MFLIPRLTPRAQDVLLAFSAGIMLAATFFSLIQPGLDAAAVVTEHPGLGAGIVILGVLFGAAALFEVAAYFIPFFDNLLDTVAGPAAVIASIRRLPSSLSPPAP